MNARVEVGFEVMAKGDSAAMALERLAVLEGEYGQVVRVVHGHLTRMVDFHEAGSLGKSSEEMDAVVAAVLKLPSGHPLCERIQGVLEHLLFPNSWTGDWPAISSSIRAGKSLQDALEPMTDRARQTDLDSDPKALYVQLWSQMLNVHVYLERMKPRWAPESGGETMMSPLVLAAWQQRAAESERRQLDPDVIAARQLMLKLEQFTEDLVRFGEGDRAWLHELLRCNIGRDDAQPNSARDKLFDLLLAAARKVVEQSQERQGVSDQVSLGAPWLVIEEFTVLGGAPVVRAQLEKHHALLTEIVVAFSRLGRSGGRGRRGSWTGPAAQLCEHLGWSQDFSGYHPTKRAAWLQPAKP